MINKVFNGTLTKHSHVCKDGKVLVKFSIKHSEVGEVQTFLQPIERELKYNNIMSLFDYEVQWKNLTIDSSDWIKRYFTVEFSDFKFEAFLTEVKITRKHKQGIDTFDYILTFQKESANDDTLFAQTYLNYKEEDENGKKITIMFDVNLTPAEEPKTAVTNSNDNL